MHDPRLEQLERLDRWLLSRSRVEMFQISLLLALIINIPNAWLLSRCPIDPAPHIADMVMVP
jgi:hypothetical protein